MAWRDGLEDLTVAHWRRDPPHVGGDRFQDAMTEVRTPMLTPSSSTWTKA